MEGFEAVRVPVGGGLEMALRSAGEGPPVVLLHGIPGSGTTWKAVAERLTQGARVVVPDLVGFGASSASESLEVIHAEGQAQYLAVALDHLEVGPATVVGHDFGGPVALALYRRRPDLIRALGLAATNAFSDTPIPFPLSAVTWPVVGPFAARLLFSALSLRMMLRRGVGQPTVPLAPDVYVGSRTQQRAIGAIFAGSLRLLDELYAPIEAVLPTVAVPTLVAWGDRDPFFPVAQGRRTAATIRGAHFELFEGAGHFLPEERPDALAEAIAGLSRRHPLAAGENR